VFLSGQGRPVKRCVPWSADVSLILQALRHIARLWLATRKSYRMSQPDKIAAETDKERERYTKLYLKALTDVVTWSTPIAIGLILWVADKASSLPQSSRPMAMVALIFLAVSLLCALCTMVLVVLAWLSQWTMHDAVSDLGAFVRDLPPEPLEQSDVLVVALERKIERIKSVVYVYSPLSHPRAFFVPFILYVIFLLVGVSLFVIAQVSGTLPQSPPVTSPLLTPTFASSIRP
jgi:hypothetical protein